MVLGYRRENQERGLGYQGHIEGTNGKGAIQPANGVPDQNPGQEDSKIEEPGRPGEAVNPGHEAIDPARRVRPAGVALFAIRRVRTKQGVNSLLVSRICIH
jgi:hypothetical protein